jgi:plastocyanin
MSRNTIIVVIVAAVLLLGGGALWAVTNHSSYNTDPMNGMDMSGDQKSSGNNTKTPAATNSVSIDNLAFTPSNITVTKGTTVTWTNHDSAAHTVTENDGQKGPDSGTLAGGKSYSFTYDTVGTFKYHCTIHSSMNGTVVVTE